MYNFIADHQKMHASQIALDDLQAHSNASACSDIDLMYENTRDRASVVEEMSLLLDYYTQSVAPHDGNSCRNARAAKSRTAAKSNVEFDSELPAPTKYSRRNGRESAAARSGCK